MERIKVLLVEDQDLLLDGMALSLQTNNDIEIIGKLKDIADYFTFDKRKDVDIILSDICTDNGHNSLDYIEKIKKDNNKIKIVLMTSVLEIDFINRAKQVDADSFVYKTIPTSELIAVIKNVMRGYSTFPLSKKEELAELKDLTDAELNIIRLFCQGYDRKEIANKLNFTEGTIRNKTSVILEKTGFSSMAKLGLWLSQNGYLI